MMREAPRIRPWQDRRASRSNGEDTSARAAWLLCRAGTILCALPIGSVIETMRMPPLERLVGVPHYISGVAVVRGAPVPVVAAGLVIGGESIAATRLVTVRAGSRTVALAVDEVIGVFRIAAEAHGRLPPLLRDAADDTISAIGARDAELLIFLRTGRLVADDVFAALESEGAAS